MTKMKFAISRVEKMLRDNMAEGYMHQTLRDAGFLAGGHLSGGNLTQSELDDLKGLAVSLSKNGKIGIRTFTEGIEAGKKEPLPSIEYDPDAPIKHYTFDDVFVPKSERQLTQEHKLKQDPAKVIDTSWVQAVAVPPPPTKKHWDVEDFCRYLELMFDPMETVGIVTQAYQREDSERWLPSKSVHDMTAGQLIEKARKKKSIQAVIGDHTKDAGAWVIVNPLDGHGGTNENVTSYRHVLLEADSDEIGKQLAIIKQLEVPCDCIVHSGHKSLHALVRLEATTMAEYRERVEQLYKIANTNGLKVDEACKNPCRLSRLPGIMRGDKAQYLVSERCGKETWAEWVEWLADQNDDLPEPVSLGNYTYDTLPPLNKELIKGVLRKKHKMLIAGPSKGGKSFLCMQLASAIARGGMWLKWKCAKGKVLILNMEMDSPSAIHRFFDIFRVVAPEAYEARENIFVWHLRAKTRPLDQLVPKMIRRFAKHKLDAIIIDPIYKVSMGDESDAEAMMHFGTTIDILAEKLDAAVIYCHHHSKGSQGQKHAIDRASGSGVLQRDPDAVLDLVELNIHEKARAQLIRVRQQQALYEVAKKYGIDLAEGEREGNPEGIRMALSIEGGDIAKEADEAIRVATLRTKKITAWRIEGSLREFAPPDNEFCWFDHPCHYKDNTGILQDLKADGEETPKEQAVREKQLRSEGNKQGWAEQKKCEKEWRDQGKSEQRAKLDLEKIKAIDIMEQNTHDIFCSAVDKFGGVGVADAEKVRKELHVLMPALIITAVRIGYTIKNNIIRKAI